MRAPFISTEELRAVDGVTVALEESTKVNSRSNLNAPGISSREDHKTIGSCFEEQVARTPGAIALVFAGGELTYRQLDDRANLLAQHLQSMGVGTETLVGILLDRSLEMMVALLAILKAGGAYVPLDPSYPSERVAFAIDDSRAAVVLSTGRIGRRLPAIADRIFSLDGSETAGFMNGPSHPVRCLANGRNLAYVIYTSGSTGKPKGVMVEHRNVLSFFSAMDQLLGNEPGVWLAETSISFDISVLELLWTLTRGFKVVLHGEEGTHTIAMEIIQHGVTHFQSTPSLARMLVADPGSLAALGSVKKLLLGGEALPATLLGTLRRVTLGEIYNIYGPTETTVWSTAYRIPNRMDIRGNIPIGQPLANTRAYLLDPDLRPVLEGEPGELFLAGAGVARGYWERPDLTAERFLPDPYAEASLMYRTGDVVRQLPDGNLEFLGRTDFQVKLRGYRIELGEIEVALEQLAAVRQAVVIAREDRPGDKRLVAYVVLNDRESLAPEALRRALEPKLAPYMVPSHFVVLDYLPLTANGKIDRKALPAPPGPSSKEPPQCTCDGPCSELEHIIGRVWSEALGVERVGADANVFDLGATSLMMPDVQIELQRRLGREVSLVDLFEFHTVRMLAAHFAGDPVGPRISNRGQRRRAARNQDGAA
jgi:amino acid adenylation domain-containing protein